VANFAEFIKILNDFSLGHQLGHFQNLANFEIITTETLSKSSKCTKMQRGQAHFEIAWPNGQVEGRICKIIQ